MTGKWVCQECGSFATLLEDVGSDVQCSRCGSLMEPAPAEEEKPAKQAFAKIELKSERLQAAPVARTEDSAPLPSFDLTSPGEEEPEPPTSEGAAAVSRTPSRVDTDLNLTSPRIFAGSPPWAQLLSAIGPALVPCLLFSAWFTFNYIARVRPAAKAKPLIVDAIKAYRNGHFDDAEILLEEALDLTPDDKVAQEVHLLLQQLSLQERKVTP